MSQLSGVLFDCDGVVIDSEGLSNQVMREDLAKRGLDLSLEQTMVSFVGGTLVGAAEHARSLGATLPDDWPEQMSRKIFDVLGREVALVPGIADVLDRLEAAGVPFAMGSNGPVTKMQLTLGRTGLLPRFEGRLFSGEDMGIPKPAPDVYLAAAGHLGVVPSQCVVIEDSVSGAKAAVAAGMRCFGFCRDTPKEWLAPYADVLFDDMAELPTLLGV